MKAIDIKGQRFGRLVAVEKSPNKRGRTAWKCVCDCGNEIIVTTTDLRRGHTRSCGCIHSERMHGNKMRETHGDTHTSLYKTWSAMKQRTSNPKTINYELYGGKGVGVCEKWLKYENFKAWATENGYEEGLTLDRIDGNGDYCPENCRWVDWETQQNNRCNNRLITFNGKTQTMSQWAREIGIKPRTLFARIDNKGWSIEKALTTPLMKHYGKKAI